MKSYRTNIQGNPEGSLGFYNSRTSDVEGDVYTPMTYCPRCRTEKPQLKSQHTAHSGYTFDCIKCSGCKLIVEPPGRLYKDLMKNVGRFIIKPPRLEHD